MTLHNVVAMTNVLSAKHVIESILLDPARRLTVLDCLIRSSQFASSIAPAALSVTLNPTAFG